MKYIIKFGGEKTLGWTQQGKIMKFFWGGGGGRGGKKNPQKFGGTPENKHFFQNYRKNSSHK